MVEKYEVIPYHEGARTKGRKQFLMNTIQMLPD